MKLIFVSTFIVSLIACASTPESTATNQHPDSIQEEVVKSTTGRQPAEAKKIRIKQPGETLTKNVLEGAANVLVDTWMDSEASSRIEKIDDAEEKKSAEKFYDEVDKRY